MTDHRQKAEVEMEAAEERWPYSHEKPADSPTNGFPKDSPEIRKERREAALVHATLYLAEQQRIANILTCWNMYGFERTFASPQKDDDLPPIIREGLGL